MAEEDSELELDRFREELESLLNSAANDEHGLQSKSYCESFCELVEEHTSRWQVPLPQLQVLRSALCAFVQGAASFPSDCEHVRYTLSSLALSVFELLLFFGRDEFPEDPLKDILDSFQECHSSLVRYQNVYLLQVRQIIKDGGPWASPVLQGILKELKQPQEEVDRYLSSEVSVFFELRVRYLLACERIPEAMALSQKCSQHLTAGRHLFFKQAYLTCLCKASQQERLFKEILLTLTFDPIVKMAEIDGKDAVEILCIAENDEKDEFLLELSKGFLLQQLRSGDMYYLWDLVFIWCKLYLRVKPSKEDFLKECKRMILSATNIKAIFPFMKVILAEKLGQDGLSFCVELCTQALQTDLKNDPVTKSLIYKTIAYLLPSDLEICRACALLVFFLERTVEAYKTVFLLYTHPDQEYHLDDSPVGNDIRFEVIQMLKKDLFFDPEFWSLLNIKTNCLKLMSDKVAKAALCEIMEEDKWVPNYCARGHCNCHIKPERTFFKPTAERAGTNKQEVETVENRLKHPSGDASSTALPPKKRGRKPGSQIIKDLESFSVRRSFRQLDLAQNHSRQLNNRRQRFITRQVENTGLKRRGRKPRWLLEELAAQAENSAPRQGKKPGRKPKQLNVLKDITLDTPIIEITMELSYPDNEVDLPADVQSRSISTITSTVSSFDDPKSSCQGPTRSCNENPISLNQVLSQKSTPLYKEKAKAAEEFIFRVQDGITFVKKFHNYSKVPEEEELSNDMLSNTEDVTVKQDRTLEVPTLVKISSEPVVNKTAVEIEVTSQTPTVTNEISGPLESRTHANAEMHPVLKTPSVPIVKDAVNPGNKVSMLDMSTVESLSEKKTCSLADNTPDTTDTTSVSNNTPNVCSSVKETCSVSLLENALKTIARSSTTPVGPQRMTNTMEIVPDNTPDASREVLEISEMKPGSPAEEENNEPAVSVKKKMAEKEEQHSKPSVTNSSAPKAKPTSILHRCRLCNTEFTHLSILSHAFYHYKSERKCMFCTTFASARGLLCHFKKHIKVLKDVKEKKSEEIPEPTEKPDQSDDKPVPKKVRPGLAQIKSRLLMRLNIIREASAKKDVQNSSDNNRRPFKQKLIRKSGSVQESKGSDEEKNNNGESIPNRKTRYLTRSLVRKSESRRRFLRKRLARKAKTRASMSEREILVPRDGSAQRINGVLRKKQKIKHSQGEDDCAVDKNVQPVTNEENHEEKMDMVEKMENDEAKHAANTKQEKERKGLNLSKLEAKAKLLEKLAKRNEDVKPVKKRKLDGETNEQEQSKSTVLTMPPGEQENVVTDVTNGMKQENGSESESNETSKSVQKTRKIRTVPLAIRCPVETCTFHAKPGPVLSHVLFHHTGDMKALEFFYNLAKEKCLFCSRRIWTSQHFFDHVVSHRGNLKHSCYHVDCEERFKTRLELIDHMAKDHQPLKAVCCFPGCTVHASNPKLLYSHERVHYKVKKKVVPQKDKSETPKVDEVNPAADEKQHVLENVEIFTAQTPPLEVAEQGKSTTPGKPEEELPLTLNKGPVNYAHKSPKLVNGHSDHQPQTSAKNPVAATKEEVNDYGKLSAKPFVRPPPSAYLDELYISMPKRWKGPQEIPKGSQIIEVSPIKRQICPRCSASFNTEAELQEHRIKCTSLFGFDSDDESAS